MNKEPIGLYIFRFVLGLGLFAFMCMLYWSSVLIEEDMNVLRSDLVRLKNDLFAHRQETNKIRDDVVQLLLDEQRNWQQMMREAISNQGDGMKPPLFQVSGRQATAKQKARPYIDPTLPNLLHEDPFYAVTLPQMLGKNFVPHGTFRSAVIGKPHNLHPFSNWSHISAWIGLCSVSVAQQQFGKYETIAPNMAVKMERRTNKDSGKPEFWVHLRDGVFWEPLEKRFFDDQIDLAPHFLRKHPVTAHDFKFNFDAVMNPHVQEPGAIALRTYIGDIEEIVVVDDLTFIVRWKTQMVNGRPMMKYSAALWTGHLRPLASFVYQYFSDGSKIVDDDNYLTNSIWAQNFAQHWAKNIIPSCGPWLFDGMSDRQIKFRRNTNYYFPLAALGERMEIAFKSSPDAIWQDFKSNNLDSYNLQPDQEIELEEFLNSKQYIAQADQGAGIERLDYLARSYNYIGWNQSTPYFSSKKVRQAMTMAIDRQRIIDQNLNGMGMEITGSFYRFSPAYDASIEPWPFDPQRAQRLLEEEGWYDSDGDGILDKLIGDERVSFIFTLTYYVKNPITKAICEYIATALKEIGIICNLNGVDIADLSATFEDKSFDAIYLGWGLGTPPEDPRQLWHSEGARQPGSSNAVGFSNSEVDSIIDALVFEYDPKKRIQLYHRFDQIIHDEQPYTFLYSPKTALLYRDYLQNVFIPADRQDLVPGANVAEPDSNIFWLKKQTN
ncbi:MAG: permease [Chlamydiales bacterium]|nr:permease [Chlamydiales bacterium]